MFPFFARSLLAGAALFVTISLQAVGAEIVYVDGVPCGANRLLIRFEDTGALPPQTRVSGKDDSRDLAKALGLPEGVTFGDPKFAKSRELGAASARSFEKGSVRPDGCPFQVVHLNGRISVKEGWALLRHHPLLDYAEPDWAGWGGGTTPDDPAYDQQWHLERIGMPAVWDCLQGSEEITVAILDSGLNTSLGEFEGRVVPGYDFVDNDESPDDPHGHGTAVAGVLAANADNGRSGAGVNWACKVMPVRVLDAGLIGFYSDWASGIDFAVANGAKVINLSAGGRGSSITLTNSIRQAVAAGVIVVTIAQNDGEPEIRFPGILPETITVGATDRDDVRVSFSNFGPELDLVAPGHAIVSLSKSGSLKSWSGTSLAAPQVAGVCALLAGRDPGMTLEQARALLNAGADDQVGDATDLPGFDLSYGYGRLNAHHSVELAKTRFQSLETAQDGAFILRWSSPRNASMKRPFAIEYGADGRTWTRISVPQQIVFGHSHAEWRDDGSETGLHPALAPHRFYRVVVTAREP